MARGQAQLKRLSEEEARQLMEALRWPNGPVCPFCRSKEFKVLEGRTCRAGLKQCKDCGRQYTVTVGTVMERTRIKMWQWVYCFAAMAASKKGISSHQLHRELGVTYKTAWFMCQRARYAMKHGPDLPKLEGVLEADETYVGGKPRNPGEVKPKCPVVTLVARGGDARSVVTCDVTAKTLRGHVLANADLKSRLMTDENRAYHGVGKKFEGGHEAVKHAAREYSRGDVNSNTVESYFSLLKRSVYGTFHHVSPEHLHLYVAELDFKWNNRKVSDTERAFNLMGLVDGKRLFYRKPAGIEAGK